MGIVIVVLATLVLACGSRVAPQEETTATAPTPTASPAPSPTPSTTPRLGLPEMVFRDEQKGTRLSIQLAPDAKDRGHFALTAYGYGAYSAFADAGLTDLGGGKFTIRFTGTGSLAPLVEFPSTQFPNGRIIGSLTQPSDVTLALEAALDADAHVADATSREGARTFVLHSRLADVSDLPAMLDRLERAMVANDGAAIWELVNSDIRGAFTQSAFAADWASQSLTIGRITRMRRGAIGNVTANSSGYSVVLVPYETERLEPNGTTSTKSLDVYFIHERPGWRLLFSSP